jgi:hypothetical protein
MSVLWRASIVLIVACGGSKPATVAYVRRHVDGVATAPCVAWSPPQYTYELDPALSARTPGDHGRAAVNAAVASWRAVAAGCSSFQLVDGMGASKKNLIVWRETHCDAVAPPNDPCFADGTCDDKYACWDGDPMSLAVTTLTYSRSTGTLLGAEIQLDGADWLFTTVDSPPCKSGAPATDCVATDTQNTLTHELGHAIGLDHVDGSGSTMSPTSPEGETSKRVIDPGTAEGFCAIYPRMGPSTGCNGAP